MMASGTKRNSSISDLQYDLRPTISDLRPTTYHPTIQTISYFPTVNRVRTRLWLEGQTAYGFNHISELYAMTTL